jgi:redox-sensitive bicupin YhaK (pirin superfamily)
MFQVRKADQRGHADHGWLNTYHTFSFAGYQDPQHMGFRVLRVMNEDRVAPGQGFGTHAHDNMEIISYVLAGALEHKDSMGNGEVLRPGEFQRISAGSGITHSEFNPSAAEPVHFYQIWLEPNVSNIEPSYEQKEFADEEKRGRLRLVASPDGRDGSLRIHQDANVFLSVVSDNTEIKHSVPANRYAWLQLLSGGVTVNGHSLASGDGVAISDEPAIVIQGNEESEFMLFDLA